MSASGGMTSRWPSFVLDDGHEVALFELVFLAPLFREGQDTALLDGPRASVGDRLVQARSHTISFTSIQFNP